MKKFLLSLSLAAGTFFAQANSLTVQSLIPGNVTLRFYGVNPDGSGFTTPPITFTTGSHPYANPTLLPGVVGAQTTGRVTEAFGVCNPYDLALGSPNIGMVTSTQVVGTLNDCNNHNVFTMTWNEQSSAPYNAVILIF